MNLVKFWLKISELIFSEFSYPSLIFIERNMQPKVKKKEQILLLKYNLKISEGSDIRIFCCL